MVNCSSGKLENLAQAWTSYNKLYGRRSGPDGYDFVAVLKACSLAKAPIHGRIVHTHVVQASLELNTHVQNTLINMYAKSGCLEDAFYIFHVMPKNDIVTWNVMIGGYAQLGYTERPIQLWQKMQLRGLQPDRYTFVCIIKVCSTTIDLDLGKLLYYFAVASFMECDVFIRCALIDMYANCASLEDAQCVFDSLPEKTLVTWNALITGHAHHGDGWEAVILLARMHKEGFIPNQVTLVSIIKACSSLASSKLGKQVHAYIIEVAFEFDAFISSALIDMYSQGGCVEETLYVFNVSTHDDTITWSALIAGLVRNCLDAEAISSFRRMHEGGVQVSEIIYVCILKACSKLRARGQGKAIHVYVLENGFELGTSVGNVLIDMLIKCGSLGESRMIFDKLPNRDVVSWNSMVAGYAENSRTEAFELFYQMEQLGVEPDNVTMVCMLKACTRLLDLDRGKYIHGLLNQKGLAWDLIVMNALIDMYNKCDSITDAQKLFSQMPVRDAVTWSAMLAGLVQHKRAKEAVFYFQQMLQEAIDPNEGVMGCVLNACAEDAALHVGKLLHEFVIELEFDSEVAIGNTLIDMYANSGSLEDACKVFQKMDTRNETTWTSIITGFGRYEKYEVAMKYFVGMQEDGLEPNDVTFVCLLSACSRVGLLEEGCDLFCSTVMNHSIKLTAQHYNCMVDLLGRANQLKKAEELLISMPFFSNVIGWSCLLGHCKTHGSVEVGRRCYEKVIAMDPGNTSAYPLMVSIYADAGLEFESKDTSSF